MKLFDTQTQQIEPFAPIGKDVTLVVYGILPYNDVHLGQAFTYCAADVLVRYLEMKGWRVKYCQKATDINVETLHKAKSLAEDPRVQSPKNRRTKHLIEDLRSLNMRPPDFFLPPTTLNPKIKEADLLVTNREYEATKGDTAEGRAPTARFWLNTAVIENKDRKRGELPDQAVTVRNLLQRFPPDALRIYLAQHHYRQPWSHNEVTLEKAAQCFEKLKAAMAAASTGGQPLNVTPAQNRFTAVMDNDLDTVKGIATLLNLADEILFRAPNGYLIDDAQVALQRMASVFGLRLNRETAEERVIAGWNKHWRRFRVAGRLNY